MIVNIVWFGVGVLAGIILAFCIVEMKVKQTRKMLTNWRMGK